jgi:DUF3017 family protein
MHNPDHPARSSHRARGNSSAGAVIPYLLILAGVAAGLVLVGLGSKHAIRGAEVAGATLLVAALARLVLPQRWIGLLASRSKTIDVLAFVVLGGGVLALALMLP